MPTTILAEVDTYSNRDVMASQSKMTNVFSLRGDILNATRCEPA